MVPVSQTTEPYGWQLAFGDEDGTFSLTPAEDGGGLLLSLSMLRVYPPMVALLRPGATSQDWALAQPR